MNDFERKLQQIRNCRPQCCCNFIGPTGPTGPQGTADTITVRNTTTGDPGTNASVTDVTGSPNHVLDFVIPRGFDGEDGEDGAAGPTGPTGPTGPKGECDCKCESRGELVVNGGMENRTNNKPSNWNFVNPDDIESENSQGRVHSGNWSVNLGDSTTLSQTINNIEGGCFYELGFFARGEGAQVGLTANVIFITTTGDVLGGTIMVRQQDITNDNRDFAYYRLITTEAPSNTTAIKIEFKVNANGKQSLDLDDVSLINL